jgi:hypothetical protein
MLASRTRAVALYVDRAGQQMIVRDADGNFRSIPPTDHPWDERRPFTPAEGTELEPVSGHYKYMFGLPP